MSKKKITRKYVNTPHEPVPSNLPKTIMTHKDEQTKKKLKMILASAPECPWRMTTRQFGEVFKPAYDLMIEKLKAIAE